MDECRPIDLTQGSRRISHWESDAMSTSRRKAPLKKLITSFRMHFNRKDVGMVTDEAAHTPITNEGCDRV